MRKWVSSSGIRNRKLPSETRLRILNTYVLSVLTYCSETWTTDVAYEACLEAAEMWFLRWMLRISWTAHESNDNVLIRAGTGRHLLATIRTRQAEFLGHVIRKSQLENLVITGKFDGKKGPGRPRTSYLPRGPSLKKWLHPTANENTTIQTSANGDIWRDMIANTRTGHGTQRRVGRLGSGIGIMDHLGFSS